MASEHWPTYVLLAVYVTAMIIVTIIANIKNRKNTPSHKPIESNSNIQSTNYQSNEVTTHFLAAKNFGFIILLLTTFASVFSGYTLVGVPNEAGKFGFTAIRWIAGIVLLGCSLTLIFPRFRRLSVTRNYESPGDFIHDRYNSKLLCILVSLCLCIPQLLYLAVQIYSLGTVLSSLTNNELSFFSIIIVSSLLILIFEVFGGMRSVAYTDTVQATIMVIVFLAVPVVITIQYGGFMGQVVNSDDLPCNNSNDDETSGCLNYSDNGIAEEYFLRTPSSITTVNYLLFTMALFSFSINPHVLQRAMAAKHDWQVKSIMKCMFIAGFVCMVPGVLYGITYISNKPSFNEDYQSFGAFQAMLAVFRDEGGFIGFLSYIALLAGIAGIMSTADSSLIGVSNTISIDLFQNWLTPNAEPTKIVRIGEIISLFTMLFSVGIAIYIYQTEMEYGVILTLQQGILWQAFPAYVFGLYTSIGTKSVLFGIIIGAICDMIFVGMVFSGNDPFAAADPTLESLDKAWSSLIGVLVNLIVCFVCHFGFGFTDFNDDEDAEVSDNQQEVLSISKIREIMRGIREPVTRYYGVFVWLTIICVFISAFHWIGEIDPELIDEYGREDVRSLGYNGYIDVVYVGLPKWAFASIIWYVIGSVFGIVGVCMWDVDGGNEDKLPTKAVVSEEQRQLSPRSKGDLRGIEIETQNVAYVDEDEIEM